MFINNVLKACMMLMVLFMSGCSCKFTPASQQSPKLVIINVLDKEFYDDCHIKGSICVPFMQVQEYAAANLDKDIEIVLYCGNYKCTASGEAARQLKAMGYNKVWAYEGGSAEWMHLNYPTKGLCRSPFLQDYEKLEEEHDGDTPIITAQELKKKIDEML